MSGSIYEAKPPLVGAGRRAVGPALRALCYLLNELDPQQHWAGLHKTPTPDGNILWLCQEHRQLYPISVK